MKVLAAMSGGVDSAVAAARAVEAGHEVTGVHLALAPAPAPAGGPAPAHGCCTAEDARDARRAADALGIPFYVWDLAERFRAEVVADFLDEYAGGRTPNPCVRCNERVKFAAVLDRARALGFDAVCTGHYARLVDHPDGRRTLHRAADAAKDQSYVLGVLTGDQLAGAMFPLGAATKSQVRAEAAARGLQVAAKPDSYEICFVPPGGLRGWLAERLGPAPGPVVDETGTEVGRHEGVHGFTVGQRRGLGLGRAADGAARYVVGVSAATATVTVGPAEALGVRALAATRPRWTGAPPAGPVACLAQVRAHGAAVPCEARLDGGTLLVAFAEPVRGIAPGQTVVLYDGDRVLGAATIASTGQDPPCPR